MLSIIIPTLNEAEVIEHCLNDLQELKNAGNEIIVVDGRSKDNTVDLARPLSSQLIVSEPARSTQMNIGARHAKGKFLLFLHADTTLPENIDQLIALINKNEKTWGRFDVRLTNDAWWYRVIELCMNQRSRITGIATGDQAIFVHKMLFTEIDGFPELPLMEDIAISKMLNKISRPVCLHSKVSSSSRRWEKNGVIRTILKMWLFRLVYFFGYDASKLAQRY